MSKYINADQFERDCMFDRNCEDMQDVIYKLRDYPSADVAEVVRCKDCKYRLKEWRGDKRLKDKGYWVYACEHFAELMGYWGWGGNDYDFCSRGERKETE